MSPDGENRNAAEVETEQPPWVQGLIMRTITQSEQGFRALLHAVGQRTLLVVWGAGSVLLFLFVAVASFVQEPGVVGAFKGVAAGLFLALLFAVFMGWTLLWAFRSPKSKPVSETDTVAPLESVLAPVLRELNAVRRDVMQQVKARSVMRVPLGVGGAFVLWILAQRSDDPPGVLMLPLWLVIGAVAGEIWAAHKLEKEYRRLYKSRVLPRLAARIGDLTYRHASAEEVRKLQAYRVFGQLDRVHVEDEICGTHRGLPVSIVEAKLERRVNNETRVVFDGLLIQLTLPRALTGTTAITTDEGALGNFKSQWRAGALEPVRLEDQEFEKRYEVYSTDQIEARALLTPAFMQRFMALGRSAAFSLPGALAEGNRLMVALPKTTGRDLLEPPEYWKPAGGRALLQLDRDIRAVLDVADTVMDLDFWSRGRKQDTLDRPS